MAKKIIIIGGGISGLAAAHRLTELAREKKAPLEITILEASPRWGGLIQTEAKNGFLLEAGPDSFISEKPAALELCRRLGLESEMIATGDQFRQSFISWNRRLIPVPRGFYLAAPGDLKTLFRLPFLSLPGKLRMACDLFIPPAGNGKDESVGSFIRRRLGREALERIAQPMIGGIYTADADKLSLKAAMPQFAEMEREHGSLIRALRARSAKEAGAASGPRYSLFLSFQGGMEEMVKALLRKIPEVRMRTDVKVEKIAPRSGVILSEAKDDTLKWSVHLPGEILEADAICLAVPAHAAARLVKTFAADLFSELEAIPYESVVTVNMAFRKEDVLHPLDGFGYVVPASQKRKIVGCTFAHVKYPGRAPEGDVLLRAFAGGAFQRELFEWEDAALERAVREEFREMLGIRRAPLFTLIRRSPDAMPQYHVGHLERVDRMEALTRHFPGLYLAGNAYRGVGIPDSIAYAEKTAEAIYRFILSGRGVSQYGTCLPSPMSSPNVRQNSRRIRPTI